MTIEELFEQQAAELERQQKLENRIYCCTAAGCVSSGSEAVRKAVNDEIKTKGLEGKVECCGTGCMGLCSRGPLVRTSKDNVLYGNIETTDAAALVSEPEKIEHLKIDTSAPFFVKTEEDRARQQRVTWTRSGSTTTSQRTAIRPWPRP